MSSAVADWRCSRAVPNNLVLCSASLKVRGKLLLPCCDPERSVTIGTFFTLPVACVEQESRIWVQDQLQRVPCVVLKLRKFHPPRRAEQLQVQTDSCVRKCLSGLTPGFVSPAEVDEHFKARDLAFVFVLSLRKPVFCESGFDKLSHGTIRRECSSV